MCIVQDAFEHYVLHQLRNDSAFVPELDFVMFLNENGEEGKLIGQNIFMRTTIKSDDGKKYWTELSELKRIKLTTDKDRFVLQN